VDNAHDRQTRGREDNGEAIRRDDGQGQMRAIGDQTIPWRAPHQRGVIRLGQDNDPIAMHLPECQQIVRIEADCLTESNTVAEDPGAVVAAPEPQI
jgi:hypothetical protein